MPTSKSLLEKIALRLGTDPVVEEVESLLHVASSDKRFDNSEELSNYLSEGAMLNISVIGSKALSIPHGEYMVWTTDVGNTILVPHKTPDQEVYEAVEEQYEVQTSQLLNNWNKVERTLYEAYGDDAEGGSENLHIGSHDSDKSDDFTSTIDASTVDRTPILRAMQDTGMTETELADACGVDVPAISRILRKPKDTTGDPGGRNPSMGLASQICNHLRIDPTAAFPDIFGVKSNYKPRAGRKNRGSGMTNAAHGSTKKGEATEKFTQGNTGSVGESINRLCEDIACSGHDFNVVWESVMVPTLLEGTARDVDGLLREFDTNLSRFFKNPFASKTAEAPSANATDDDAVNKAYANRLAAGKGKTASTELMGGANKREEQWAKRQQSVKKTIGQVWKEFNAAIQNFQKGIRDRMVKLKDQNTARHVWNIVDHLAKHASQSANEFLSTMELKRDPAGVARNKEAYAKALATHQGDTHFDPAT